METKETAVEKTVTYIAIEDEYEGIGPIYFDLNDPQMFVNYLKDNIDRGQSRKFFLKEMTAKDISELLTDD